MKDKLFRKCFITARKRSCGKVMFSEVFVCPNAKGMVPFCGGGIEGGCHEGGGSMKRVQFPEQTRGKHPSHYCSTNNGELSNLHLKHLKLQKLVQVPILALLRTLDRGHFPNQNPQLCQGS